MLSPLLLLAILSAAMALVQYKEAFTTEEGKAFLTKTLKTRGWKETASGLQYKLLKRGPLGDKGLSPNVSSPCSVHYVGKTIKGEVFDSSRSRGRPAEFKPSDVISGWTEMLMMMHEGDQYEIVVPAELAYKGRRMGSLITPGSVLCFELELIKVKNSDEVYNPMKLIQSLKDIPAQGWVLVVYAILFALTHVFKDKIWPKKQFAKLLVADVKDKPENVRCFLDIKIGTDIDAIKGRIEVELFNSACPKTCENFRALCTGEKGKCKRKSWWVSGYNKPRPLHYKGSKFHRIIKRFMAQGGDIDGNGGESIYGITFPDEFATHGYVPHSEAYLLSMANFGPNTNASQFFITFTPAAHLDQKHVVFGRVVKGAALVDDMERVAPSDGSKVLSSSGLPNETVTIVDCGQLDKDGKVMLVAAAAAEPAGDAAAKKEQ